MAAITQDARRRAEAAKVSLAAALARVAEGARPSFEEVYRLTSAKLFGACLRILPVRSDAEEALQEVYLAVWRKAGTFDAARGNAMTWLLTLARNRAIDRLRARRPLRASPVELAEQIADPAPDAVERLFADEEERRLAGCMGRLDAGDAGFIRTAFLEDTTYSVLAERAGLPLGTVKSRIRRALLKLRECLE